VKLQDYAKKFNVKFYAKEKPWGLKGDIAFPSATENEIDLAEAKVLHKNGIKYVFEGRYFSIFFFKNKKTFESFYLGANFPTTPEAMEYFKKNNVILGPAIAANAG
jgi:glutamate dehydrogenase (NADP+)